MSLKIKLAILFCVIGLWTSALELQSQVPGKCIGHSVKDNVVIFNCENGINVHLEQFSSEIIKITYTDTLNEIRASYALIEQEQNNSKINLNEQSGSYEIYTSKLIVRVQKSPFSISIFDKWQKELMADYKQLGFKKEQNHIASVKVLKPNERIYGLGEKNGNINRRGQSFTMWNSDKPCYSPDSDPLYKSIPFFMSSEGYGIFFDNTFKSTFDFGKAANDCYSFSAPDGQMQYYFIYGPTIKQMLSNYTKLTGKAIMPPAWALGFSQCRGLLTTESLTREIAEGYRQREIPCDIIYQDIGWTQHLQDFEWREGNYENPQKMLSDLAEMGFKVVVSQDPVISQANKQQWNEADSLRYFTKDKRTQKSYDMPWPWGGNCGVVDFTNPEVADWWGNYQQKVIKDGVKGFWTDMGEPAWSNEEAVDRLNMQHHDGNHAEIHNVYGFTWDKVVTEQFEKHNPNQRIFQMTRAGYAGLQRYTFGWSGDAGNGNNPCNGWNQLSAQIPLMLSSGMGLIPFWSCDISGYCGDINDYDEMSELYIRWLQFGAFNPLSRIHHEGNNAVEPWLFGEEAERIVKEAIELKYRLFPYIYTYAREAFDKGWPLVRPLLMEYSDDPQVFNLDSQFLLGENLLVAPVVEEAASIKRVYLPRGEWIDFFNPNQVYKGKQWIEYPVTLEDIPVFVKKGAIVPTMPVMQFINEKETYPLIINVYPSNKKARFALYEDDGESNSYKKDVYGMRELTAQKSKNHYNITYKEHAKGNYSLRSRHVFYRLNLDKKPTLVSIDGKKVKKGNLSGNPFETPSKTSYYWDKVDQVLTIAVPSGQPAYHLVVE
ncbi:MAG: DUF4968 domain-containing protein [Carboxylicivirga sp.]|jgi:alpha-glucosidase|nr:DUF4968 domain-containing protein [Carboxylicivirga sp.]